MRFFKHAGLLLALLVLGLTVVGCGASLPERPTAGRHLELPPRPPTPMPPPPAVISQPPLPAPGPIEQQLELFSVEVHDVPVRELLFALARDAAINVDIHPEIQGKVTLNVIDQTLPQILARVARQVSIRWDIYGAGLIIVPDRPFWRNYIIDYVNIIRGSTGQVGVIAEIGGGSVTTLTQESVNNFWQALLSNIAALVGVGPAAGGGADEVPAVIGNPETGLIAVRATARQHREVQHFIDLLLGRALRQVLIEATVVEVDLNDRYQAGIDWEMLGRDGGKFNFVQSYLGGNFPTAPFTRLIIDEGRGDDPHRLRVTIQALARFGDLRVLSSPKLMVLNNQTAMLRVVDNRVHFTMEVEVTPATADTLRTVTFETTVHTVPIGFVMAVTPQISESGQVTLNVRPTITRIVGHVNDPNPDLARENIQSRIPELQVREVESILRVASGQIAVLGGLMQDSMRKEKAGPPVLSRMPVLRNVFGYREETASKTELVIFIRPVVVRQASLDADLREYRDFLKAPPIPRHPLGPGF